MSLADLQEHIIRFEMFFNRKKVLEVWLEVELAVSGLSRFISQILVWR